MVKPETLDDSVKYVDEKINKSSKSGLLIASFFLIINKLATCKSEVI
jgi:hypothetical protein